MKIWAAFYPTSCYSDINFKPSFCPIQIDMVPETILDIFKNNPSIYSLTVFLDDIKWHAVYKRMV